ncbi:ATP-binding protein [Fulvivirgaceae bacterium BMA12]|uniref:histidine kinase n=1 Tax=Agaribacillus aureus TaxID=3051825 RepID=A0ABT8L1W0_9BACT|nr:ATP-binding protein [Fulvivirgaceae bacterium BMA12]
MKTCPRLSEFLQAVSSTYEHYEKDRQLLERSMNLSSKELYCTNEKLREDHQKQKVVLDKLKEAISELNIEENPHLTTGVDENDLVAMVDLLQEKIHMTKEFEEELRVSGLKFQAIVENTADIIWSVDEHLRLSIFNSFYRKNTIAKHNIDPVLGDKLSNIIPPKEYKELEDLLKRAINGERFIIEEVHNKNSQPLYFETSFNPIRDEHKITGISVFSRDITFRKEDEKRKNELLRDLQSANEELEQIAYITSHDLKTPLRSIGSIASWIKSDYQHLFDDLSKEQIDILISRVDRLYNLIDGISLYMSLSSVDEEEREIVDFGQIISKVINTLNVPAHISVEIVKSLPKAAGIKTHIYLVFEQVIKNAILFMDKKQGRISIDFRQKENDLEFIVADNGPGIDQKYHQKIFKIFQALNARDQMETNGIGLAIAKKIVKMTGGDINIESTPGEGSTFIFNFNY